MPASRLESGAVGGRNHRTRRVGLGRRRQPRSSGSDSTSASSNLPTSRIGQGDDLPNRPERNEPSGVATGKQTNATAAGNSPNDDRQRRRSPGLTSPTPKFAAASGRQRRVRRGRVYNARQRTRRQSRGSPRAGQEISRSSRPSASRPNKRELRRQYGLQLEDAARRFSNKPLRRSARKRGPFAKVSRRRKRRSVWPTMKRFASPSAGRRNEPRAIPRGGGPARFRRAGQQEAAKLGEDVLKRNPELAKLADEIAKTRAANEKPVLVKVEKRLPEKSSSLPTPPKLQSRPRRSY